MSFLICEFQLLEHANIWIKDVNRLAVPFWKKIGYTVVANELGGHDLIAKGYISRKNIWQGPHTTTWGNATATPDNTFFVPSLSNYQMFAGAMKYFPENKYHYIEKIMPESWYARPE